MERRQESTRELPRPVLLGSSSQWPKYHGKCYRHGQVPRSENLEAKHQGQRRDAPVTTLMLRNIPNRYTQQDLMAELDGLGFHNGCYDFLYLPVDNGTLSNVGYAFLNFVEEATAQRCKVAFQGHRFRRQGLTPGKVASVSVAHIQGLEANLRHYERAAVSVAKNKERRPVVLAKAASLLGRG